MSDKQERPRENEPASENPIAEVASAPDEPEPEPKPTKIIRHELDRENYSVTFTVKFDDGSPSKMKEFDLQRDRPGMVYSYWKIQGARCEATGFDKYHAFAILAHVRWNAQMHRYKIQWIGYSKTEATWEDEENVADWAGPLKTLYDKENDLNQMK